VTAIPGWLLQHAVTVEAWHGEGPDGPTYDAPVTVRCFLDQATRTVRATDGTQVTSSSTAYCRLDTVAPALSRVTLPDGRVTSVIAAMRRDGAALPTPSHLELQLV
jgi:hypothetical protein